MRRKIDFAAVVAALILLAASLAVQAAAQGKGKGKGNEKAKENKHASASVGDKIRKVAPASEPVFATQERTVIKRYFSTHAGSLPPGLAKRDRLPPGLEKQLRERGKLPPGLQKKIQPLPVELERQLSTLPTGYRRVVIGNNVILMNRKTALIYDIVRSVIP